MQCAHWHWYRKKPWIVRRRKSLGIMSHHLTGVLIGHLIPCLLHRRQICCSPRRRKALRWQAVAVDDKFMALK
jgi:hypothetical protein